MDSSSAIRGTLAGVVLAAIALCPFNEQATALVDAAAVTKTKARAHVTIQAVAGTGLAGQSGQVAANRAVPIRIRPKKSRPTLIDQIDTPAAAIASRSVDAASAADVASAPAAEKAVSFALEQLGLPYEWGGAGPSTYDCSGLTMRAYQAAGYQLPRTAAEQAHVGQPVDLQHLLPGDLLFYVTDPSDLDTVHHVVMYIGNGLVVHAPHTGDVVRVGPMWTGSEYVGAVRIVPGLTQAAASKLGVQVVPSGHKPARPVGHRASPKRTPKPSKSATALTKPTAHPTPRVTPTHRPLAVALAEADAFSRPDVVATRAVDCASDNDCAFDAAPHDSADRDADARSDGRAH